MTASPTVARYAAFADDPELGNPAGVVLDAQALTDAEMQRIATDTGYSETAFVTSFVEPGPEYIDVRYFAPDSEVDFCGHASVATAVALGDLLGPGDYILRTRVGDIHVSAWRDGRRTMGAFRSAAVSSSPITTEDLDGLLRELRWSREDLHPDFPPAVAFGGNHHPVLVAKDVSRLADLEYDFDGLRSMCRARGWVTIQLLAADGQGSWRSRNPFPWGGVVEDPATGSAAAAFAGYLRALGQVVAGDWFTILQGVEMGRPSRIEVEVLATAALISGPAAVIP
ncbi:PhzF family phenazine biosynthesis isomerase [Nocardioides sp. WS12]|uniref:PhzF family phenazine biosynthesis protein n=1 Tax=Nocardioides sp. WS12 TaxID=2486272 RepID=UPI0015FCC577|nr:PhzF family phenazine biosynthesis isomerase [Nocardioides sp. WS12]